MRKKVTSVIRAKCTEVDKNCMKVEGKMCEWSTAARAVCVHSRQIYSPWEGSTMGSEQRQRIRQIKIRVTPEELEAIARNAAGCSLTVPEFLRRLGQGAIPRSTLDSQRTRELCQAAGDLGRMGGLLKQWMGARRSGEIKDGVPLPLVNEVFENIRQAAADLRSRVLSI
jgi:hypothetical protein